MVQTDARKRRSISYSVSRRHRWGFGRATRPCFYTCCNSADRYVSIWRTRLHQLCCLRRCFRRTSEGKRLPIFKSHSQLRVAVVAFQSASITLSCFCN
ncbi:unnamed protein product [Ixodes persulcatus]